MFRFSKNINHSRNIVHLRFYSTVNEADESWGFDDLIITIIDDKVDTFIDKRLKIVNGDEYNSRDWSSNFTLSHISSWCGKT